MTEEKSPGNRRDEGQEGPQSDLQRRGPGLQADCAGSLLEEYVVGDIEIMSQPTHSSGHHHGQNDRQPSSRSSCYTREH